MHRALLPVSNHTYATATRGYIVQNRALWITNRAFLIGVSSLELMQRALLLVSCHTHTTATHGYIALTCHEPSIHATSQPQATCVCVCVCARVCVCVCACVCVCVSRAPVAT